MSLHLSLLRENQTVRSTFRVIFSNIKHKQRNRRTNNYLYKKIKLQNDIIVIYQHSYYAHQLQTVALTSFLFCSRSSSLSLALFPIILFRSASYCRCVLSMLILRFNATFTKAVISFMATKKVKIVRII